jgi:DNA polymerase IIIc chi subunit
LYLGSFGNTTAKVPSSNTNLVAKLAVCRLVTSVKSLGFRGSIQTKEKQKKTKNEEQNLALWVYAQIYK